VKVIGHYFADINQHAGIMRGKLQPDAGDHLTNDIELDIVLNWMTKYLAPLDLGDSDVISSATCVVESFQPQGVGSARRFGLHCYQ